ncbi:unnamed protein product [Gordionus sp. m RMFG-2023]
MKDIIDQWNRLDCEMETMKHLSTPYLSEKQEMYYLENIKANKLLNEIKAKYKSNFVKHKYIVTQLQSLYESKKWE